MGTQVAELAQERSGLALDIGELDCVEIAAIPSDRTVIEPPEPLGEPHRPRLPRCAAIRAASAAGSAAIAS